MYVICLNCFTDADKKSIYNSFDRGQTLCIIGFNNTGKHHAIAAVMHVSSHEGSYINWLVVTNTPYDKSQFGSHADKKSFCNIGLGAFLLQAVQLQAVSQGYNPNMFVQVIMSTVAAQLY